MAKYTTKDKVYSEYSMLDEMEHNIKLMLNDVVLKDVEEALKYETEESLANADVFMAIKNGNANFVDFKYTRDMFLTMNRMIVEDPSLGLTQLSNVEINEYIADSSGVPKEYRSLLVKIASELYLDNYVERNDYYRQLNGQKRYGAADFYVDPSYIGSDYIDNFVDTIYTDPYEYLNNTPITDFTAYQLSVLDTSGSLDKIIEDNPGLTYLRFLGTKAIDIYKARKAERFELLYLPEAEEVVRARFQDILEKNRALYLKRYYSEAYKFESEYYDKFMIILLISQSANELIMEIPEWYIRREVFDVRTAQYLLESNGIKFFPEIPLKYQISMVRAMNTLIKYKSTTKNIYDIAKVFFLKNVEVNKYYLVKKRNIDPNEIMPSDLNGGPAEDALAYDMCDAGFAGTESGIIYDGGTASKSTNFVTGADLEKMYSLIFIKVPIEDTLDNYLHNSIYQVPYDTITLEDDYWDGEKDHTYVKQEILKKEFTSQCTKYLSLSTSYSASEYLFQVTYFLNLFMNNSFDASKLNLTIPVINANTSFELKDVIILLYCFAFKYFENQTDDLIYVKNRDPRPYVEGTNYIAKGDYDPDTVKDYDADGRDADGRPSGCAGDYDPKELEDYDANGMYADVHLIKDRYYDVNGGSNPTIASEHMINVSGLYAEEDTYKEKNKERNIIQEEEFYTMDGGYAETPRLKMYNANGGYNVNLILDIDLPETRDIIFDPVTTDMDFDGLGVLEYTEVSTLDGGYADAKDDMDRYTDVYDGGYAVNSYLYTGNEDQGVSNDPCYPYKEPFDKFRYPTINTDTRIFGFNLHADLDELRETIGSVNHPKFGWLRGYTLEEVLPTYNLPTTIYPSIADFPEVGTINELYSDASNGKFYMWGANSYIPVNTLYDKGIQEFKVPSSDAYSNIDELTAIYENNKVIYDNLTLALRDVDSQDEYFVLEYIYEYLFTMEWDLSYYSVPMDEKISKLNTVLKYNLPSTTASMIEELDDIIRNGGTADDVIDTLVYDYRYNLTDETKKAITESVNDLYTRYTEFLKKKDGVLYSFYEKVMSEDNVTTRQYNMATYIDNIISSLEAYINTDGLDYIFYFVPTVSWGVTLKYLSLVLNFFKSYKTHILDVSGTLQFDNRTDNTMTQSDKIAYLGKYINKGESANITDVYEINASMVKEDKDMLDRNEDRIFIHNSYDTIVDLNGGDYRQSYYSLDLEGGALQNAGAFYAGTTSIVEFDGGNAEGIDTTTYGDYNPQASGDYDCNGKDAKASVFYYGKYYIANGGKSDNFPSIDVNGKNADGESGEWDKYMEIYNSVYIPAKAYNDSLAGNYEPSGSASRALFNAKEYMDYIGQENYDPAGAATIAYNNVVEGVKNQLSFIPVDPTDPG